ncbi:MAG: hypothetical protein EZS28_015166 [Streblomastix strix]|uniref:Right handed beta helix domain-containing protein n=1 Tax=Streblomastix strix TaxID=222440 RepID=A0A5J4W354_9EUKA|nr:MAG: hypothetical protein EZS28_015166 [Streblomastix strix]
MFASLTLLVAASTLSATYQSSITIFSDYNYSNTTSPLTLTSDQNGDQLIVKNCTFTNCSNIQTQGGAISSSISNGVIVLMSNSSFINCYSTKDGGAIWMQVGSGSIISIEDCIMTKCYSIKNGGSLFILILSTDTHSKVELVNIQMTNCSSQWYGGGIYAETNDNSTLSLIGEFLFDNCSSINSDYYGGGIYVYQKQPMHSIQMQGNFTFRNCTSRSYGGGIYMITYYQKPITINSTFLFQNCRSSNGGGLRLTYQGDGDLTQLAGNFTFQNCSAQSYGGGMQIQSTPSIILEIDDFTFKDCSGNQGGGIFLSLMNNSKLIINGGHFNNSSASMQGGGIFAQFSSNSELILNNSCEFNQCSCNGSGGAIYIIINYSRPFLFIINNTLIQECRALYNSQYSHFQSGFGGGIFISGSGDYDSSTKRFDFKGMRIFGNGAEYGGKSLNSSQFYNI